MVRHCLVKRIFRKSPAIYVILSGEHLTVAVWFIKFYFLAHHFPVGWPGSVIANFVANFILGPGLGRHLVSGVTYRMIALCPDDGGSPMAANQ